MSCLRHLVLIDIPNNAGICRRLTGQKRSLVDLFDWWALSDWLCARLKPGEFVECCVFDNLYGPYDDQARSAISRICSAGHHVFLKPKALATSDIDSDLLSHAANRLMLGDVSRITVFTCDGGIVMRDPEGPDRFRSLVELRDELAPALNIRVIGYKPLMGLRARQAPVDRLEIRDLRCPNGNPVLLAELPAFPPKESSHKQPSAKRFQRVLWRVYRREGKWLLPSLLADGTLGYQEWKPLPQIQRSTPLVVSTPDPVIPSVPVLVAA